MNKEIKDRVISLIDRERLEQLAMDLVNIPSPTGQEGAVSDFILGWLKGHGFKAFQQEVEEGRPNVVGVLPGDGSGCSLTFNSHMDTSFTGTDADYLTLGEVSDACKARAYRDGGRICGLGINNDKGPLAAFLTAALAVRQSGVALKGDLVLAGVVGEIGRAPVGSHRGPGSRGKGVGTRFLLTHGVVTDYALVAEPSSFTMTWALPGAVFLRLTTRGRPAYTPFTRRDEKGVSHENAIVRMLPVLEAFEDWGRQYQEARRYKFSGGEIIPKVNIGAIEGGMPIKPNYSPAICHAYVDIRTPPGANPLEIKREVEGVLSAGGLAAEVDMFLSQKGYEGVGVEPLVEAVKDSHLFVFGDLPKPISAEHTSMWNDVNIYHEYGIPSIKYGPPTITYGFKREECLNTDDLLRAAQVYALAALEICGRAR